MSITLVQQAATSSSTPSTTATLNGVALGNTLICKFDSGVPNIADITVSDNNGNFWQIAESLTFSDGSNHTVGIAYALNVNAGNTTVTASNNQSQPIVCNLEEWNSGVVGAPLALDKIATGTGTGTSMATSAVSPTKPIEMLACMMHNGAGSNVAGSGFTANTNFLTAVLPEYQVITGGGSQTGTATGASGTWGIVMATFLIARPIFSVITGRFDAAGALVGRLVVPIWANSNVVPVTVNANVTSDQILQTIVIPALTLNSVGRTLQLEASGVFSTPAASVATLEFKVTLGSLTLIDIVTTGNAGNLTNNKWILTANLTTQTAGASADIEASGCLTINIGAITAAWATDFLDTNTGTLGTIDLTSDQTLQITVAFSAASASNSCTGRQMTAGTSN